MDKQNDRLNFNLKIWSELKVFSCFEKYDMVKNVARIIDVTLNSSSIS